MDINDLRAAVTLISFIAFMGICWWALSARRSAAFKEAASLPLNDDKPYSQNTNTGAGHE